MNSINNKTVRKRSEKSGMPPGTLIHVGTPKSEKSIVNAIIFDQSEIKQLKNVPISEALVLKDSLNADNFLWINVDGLADLNILKQIGDSFSIHPLVLEDISNPNQRPKAEHFENYTFLVLRAFNCPEVNKVDSEQISIIVGSNFIISFQEKEGNAFSKIEERMHNTASRLRASGVDYLAYAMLDLIIDGYFSVLENFGDQLETIEHSIIEKPSGKTLQILYTQKRKALEIRRAIWPLRELLSNLDRSDSKYFTTHTKIYLRDVYSHVVELIDTLEIYREMLSGLLDIYLSSQSNRLNEVMKVLTVITTIFMPLTFIAGVYGMNFKYMPELEISYAYPLVIIIMLTIATIMFVAFKRKKWV